MDDFVTFSEAGKAEDDEDAGNFVDEEEEGEEYGLSSNKPPATVTKNADCDWCDCWSRILHLEHVPTSFIFHVLHP